MVGRFHVVGMLGRVGHNMLKAGEMVAGCRVDFDSAKACNGCGGYVGLALDYVLCSCLKPRILLSGDSRSFVGDSVVRLDIVLASILWLAFVGLDKVG